MTLHPDVTSRIRAELSYDPASGRLTRTGGKGHGVTIGKVIGRVEHHGHRRAHFAGRNWMTAHLVWAWHYGALPDGILRHINGDTADDRIENLELLKQQLQVAYVSDGSEVCQRGRLPRHIATGIYEIFCTVNGRRYIGSAVHFEKRWRLHFTQLQAGKHHSVHLQRAWNKHGADAFVFRVLEECEREQLIEREQAAIDRLAPEFNGRPDAGSQLGLKHRPESRRLMSVNSARNAAFAGRRHSEESKRQISEKKRGVAQTPEHVAKRMQTIRERGVRIGRQRFNEEQVREIRQCAAAGETNVAIARRYGVSDGVICEIKSRKAYRWVE